MFRGPEHLDRLRDCDVVFVSPGVPWRQPVFEELRRSGVRISSAADWFMSRHGAATIGVTGTKGKSTTASFLGHLLQQVGVDAVVAGNIGTPLSDLSPEPDDVVVVAELSSQQAALLTTSPAVAVITNLYEDHLDWHGDRDAYYLAKANVFRNGARTLVTTPEVRRRPRAPRRGARSTPSCGSSTPRVVRSAPGDGAFGDDLRAQRRSTGRWPPRPPPRRCSAGR